MPILRAIVCVLGALLVACSAVAAGAEAAPPPGLRLRAGEATPLGVHEGVPLHVLHLRPAAVTTARAELAARGVRVLRYLPDGALLVAGPPAATAGVHGLAAISRWRPALAVVPELRDLSVSDAARFPGGVPVVVALAPGAWLRDAIEALAGAGARVAWVDRSGDLPEIGLVVLPERLETVRRALLRTPALVWADLQPPVRLRNPESAWLCQSGEPGDTSVFDRELRGEGQIVAIMDTGIDIDMCYFRDDAHGLPAINDDVGTGVDPEHRKVLAVDFYWTADLPDPGTDAWDDNGHGTHVAGSVAGDDGADGVHSGSDGMAPAARLVIQDGGSTVDDCADLPGLGCPVRSLEPMLEQAYLQGARIHSNSWGDEENIRPFNRYTERTADIDRFMWNHKDFLVFIAGGNAGPSIDSVGSPATGKNVIAVGATLHGDADPPCVAAFSSRGWTQDGRIKPDVVAPGTVVVSAANDGTIASDNCNDRPSSGTSMSCPTVAGLAALVRQYYEDGYYPDGAATPDAGFAPSAALVKATLIASAVDLSTRGCADVDPIPSRDQGWGLVRLDSALHFAGDERRLLVDDHTTGFTAPSEPPVIANVRVNAAGPLKIVLVWTDPPSSSAAAVNLVNDLDLRVTGPDGAYLGNAFDLGESAPSGEPDRLNNVEVVWLPTASPGRWTITVSPHAINEAPQDYALVVTGPVEPESPRSGGERAAPELSW